MTPHQAVFFTHIPRSGGTSLITSLAGALPPERTYPSRVHDDMLTAKMSVRYLLGLPRSRLEQVEFFTPHMPHAVTELLGVDLYTVTLIRDPVDRIRSSLNSIVADPAADATALETVYAESAWANGWILANQLIYYLGISAEQLQQITVLDEPTSDGEFEARLRAMSDLLGAPAELVAPACRTLDSIDLLALTEQLGELFPVLEAKLGLPPGTADVGAHRNRGAGRPFSPSLRRRVEASCEADRAVYEYAVELIARRRAEQTRATIDFGG